VIWFSDAELRQLAGPRSYARAEEYLDAVVDLEAVAGGVIATVWGNHAYEVHLHNRDNELEGECTCPYGQEGAFCKHCVAVGLILLADGIAQPCPPATELPSADLRAYLESREHQELVHLLWAHAQEDPTLHRRLSLRAAAATGEPDIAALRTQIDSLRTRGRMDYRTLLGYTAKANDVLDALAALLPGHAATVRPLVLDAVERLAQAAERADDSVGIVADECARALSLYAQACAAAPPDELELAQWLVDFQLDGVDWPDIDIAEFADALGERGRAEYRAYLDDLHSALPPAEGPLEHRRLAITHLRESLARAEGDVDRLVEVYAEDLSAPHRYARIASTLRDAGRISDAIDWAERGSRAATRPDHQLDDLLASLYSDGGRLDEAVSLRRRTFARTATASTYSTLKATALRAEAWPEVREWAHEMLHAQAARGAFAADPLVAVLESEDGIEVAWAAAKEYGCSADMWLHLADRRARTHPADAIPAYIAAVDRALERKNTSAYREAIGLLTTLKDLHDRAGLRFADYLAGLKEVNHRKTRFLQELALARL
jgi:uncharacterized Zn finger protein